MAWFLDIFYPLNQHNQAIIFNADSLDFRRIWQQGKGIHKYDDLKSSDSQLTNHQIPPSFGDTMYRRVIVPARVNIIGEHTDYANGLALPFAIDKKLELVIKPLQSGFKGDESVMVMCTIGGYQQN